MGDKARSQTWAKAGGPLSDRLKNAHSVDFRKEVEKATEEQDQDQRVSFLDGHLAFMLVS